MTQKKPVSGKTSKPAGKNHTDSGAAPKAAAPEAPSAAHLQLKAYEQAVGLFSQGRLGDARGLFLQVAKGPAPHISDKARTYIQICERRAAKIEPELKTADDHFNYGVERLNARDVERARHHLGRALSLKPEAEHILYTLALCCGLAGDGNGACENLRRAIELEPRNRILARQDPEFAALASQLPALRLLLISESSGRL